MGLKQEFEEKFCYAKKVGSVSYELLSTEKLWSWIESKIKEAKMIKADDYLIELSDGQYQTVTETELNGIYDSAYEFDGFTGIRVIGKIKTLGEK